MNTQLIASVPLGYYSTFGWIDPNLGEPEEKLMNNLTNNFTVMGDTLQIGGDTINNISIGQDTADSKTVIKTEDFAVGRYIYMNRGNEITDTGMDSGLVMNVTTLGSIPIGVQGAGFSPGDDFSNATVEVDLTTGLLPSQYISVTGSQFNDGVYVVATHLANILTISGPFTPTDDFCSGNFVPEEADSSIKIYHCKISVLRGTNDSDSIEYGVGMSAPISFKKMLYDSKDDGTLGNLTLTDNDDQLKLGQTTISATGSAHTHTIPNTADDTFVMRDATQTLKNKTMTDNTNNVTSRALWFGSGATSMNSYSSVAPTTGQFIKASGSSLIGETLFTLQTGSGLTGGTAGGSSNTSITIAKDTEADDESKTQTTSGDPNPPPVPANTPTTDLPGFDVPVNVTIAAAGAVSGAGFIAGVGGIFSLGPAQFGDDVVIEGDLTVLGTTTTVSSANITTGARYIFLNDGYDVDNTPLSTGLIVNREPDGAIYDLSDFDIDGTCTITPTSGLSANDIIHIYPDGIYTGPNSGYFETSSHSSGILTTKIDASRVLQWTKSFATETASLKAVKVNVNGLEFDSSGVPKYLTGSNTSTLASRKIAYDTSTPSFAGLDLTSVANNNGLTNILALDGTTVKYRSVSSIASSFTNVDTGIGFTISAYPSASGWCYGDATIRVDPIRGDITCCRLHPFSLSISAAESEIQLSTGSSAMPSKRMVFSILLYFDGNFETCWCISDPGAGIYRIKRANFDNFPAGTITHCIQSMASIVPEFTDFLFVKF